MVFEKFKFCKAATADKRNVAHSRPPTPVGGLTEIPHRPHSRNSLSSRIPLKLREGEEFVQNPQESQNEAHESMTQHPAKYQAPAVEDEQACSCEEDFNTPVLPADFNIWVDVDNCDNLIINGIPYRRVDALEMVGDRWENTEYHATYAEETQGEIPATAVFQPPPIPQSPSRVSLVDQNQQFQEPQRYLTEMHTPAHCIDQSQHKNPNTTEDQSQQQGNPHARYPTLISEFPPLFAENIWNPLDRLRFTLLIPCNVLERNEELIKIFNAAMATGAFGLQVHSS